MKILRILKPLAVCAALFMALSAESCSHGVNTGASTITEMEQTESNQQKLARSTPPPQFEVSLERQNLVRRLETLNVQNKIQYIYCMTLTGNVVYYGQVYGKVSSLNSLLTTPEQVVAIPMKNTETQYTYEVLPSPDFDGSYGKNPEGVFWFEPNGEYHEWNGTYFLSDRPCNVKTPVSLVSQYDTEAAPAPKK